MYEACEMDDMPIIVRGKSSKMFHASDASLDLVAMLVDAGVMRDEDLAVALEHKETDLRKWTFESANRNELGNMPKKIDIVK
jgi:hypothetical protein